MSTLAEQNEKKKVKPINLYYIVKLLLSIRNRFLSKNRQKKYLLVHFPYRRASNALK